ncbi:MAG: pseudouridine synthase [Bacteroidota bacterium]
MNKLEIIYQDEHLVAINKPHGLLVHRSNIAAEADEFALQILRDQLRAYVHPVHRLDRKTSGLLLFALDAATAAALQAAFAAKQIAKRYLAIVRGYFPTTITLDYALTNDRQKKQEAITHFRCLKTTELPIPFGKHTTSRYSLIEAIPETGRQHQIRKHCSHLQHPIIGDRPHGCNKQNRLFKERWQMMRMLLHAADLQLQHPRTAEDLHLTAAVSPTFERMQQILQL